MANEKKLATTTDILVRAFIAAFVLPLFYATPFAPLLQWHVSVIILFIGFFVAFSLLKFDDRMIVVTGALIVAANLLPLLVQVVAGGDVYSEYAPIYSLALALLSIIAAFLWPRETSEESISESLSVGDRVLLVLGQTEAGSEEELAREIAVPALVLDVEEERVKLRHRDLDGSTIENWVPIEDIRVNESDPDE